MPGNGSLELAPGGSRSSLGWRYGLACLLVPVAVVTAGLGAEGRASPRPAIDGASAGDVALVPDTVPIPAGVFWMGTDHEQAQRILTIGGTGWHRFLDWQQPYHQVYLSAYRIGRYPVTNEEYRLFVRAAGRRPPEHWSGGSYPEGTARHPVGNVSWHDAVAYCGWLAAATRRPYRLPTEAEWEKAARGTDGRFYPWGDRWDPRWLNSREAGPGTPNEVGRYSPRGDSPYGVSDMAGNVWEWTSDRFSGSIYRERRGTVPRNPSGAQTGEARVLRGGAFNLDGILLGHVGVRDTSDPDDYALDDGFRVALAGED